MGFHSFTCRYPVFLVLTFFVADNLINVPRSSSKICPSPLCCIIVIFTHLNGLSSLHPSSPHQVLCSRLGLLTLAVQCNFSWFRSADFRTSYSLQHLKHASQTLCLRPLSPFCHSSSPLPSFYHLSPHCLHAPHCLLVFALSSRPSLHHHLAVLHCVVILLPLSFILLLVLLNHPQLAATSCSHTLAGAKSIEIATHKPQQQARCRSQLCHHCTSLHMTDQPNHNRNKSSNIDIRST